MQSSLHVARIVGVAFVRQSFVSSSSSLSSSLLLFLFIVVDPLPVAVPVEFFHHSIIPGDFVREAIVPSGWDCPMKRYCKISMGGAQNPGDGSPARRLRGGAQWGPNGLAVVGGLTSTTVHFPRALGTPAASCQPPILAFARSFPPPSPTLSASHRQRQASLLLSACLSRFLFLFLSRLSFTSTYYSFSVHFSASFIFYAKLKMKR